MGKNSELKLTSCAFKRSATMKRSCMDLEMPSSIGLRSRGYLPHIQCIDSKLHCCKPSDTNPLLSCLDIYWLWLTGNIHGYNQPLYLCALVVAW